MNALRRAGQPAAMDGNGQYVCRRFTNVSDYQPVFRMSNRIDPVESSNSNSSLDSAQPGCILPLPGRQAAEVLNGREQFTHGRRQPLEQSRFSDRKCAAVE